MLNSELISDFAEPTPPGQQSLPESLPEIRAPPAQPDLVTTPRAFIQAIADGDRDIFVMQHLDLRGQNLNDYGYIVSPQRTTRAILVRPLSPRHAHRGIMRKSC